MLDTRILDLHEACGSVKETAETLGMSVVKVRRTLITAGLWRSQSSDMVCQLFDQGFSIDEIAERLSITKKAVEANAPYKQGSYSLLNRSASAERCDYYRKRKRSALSRQTHNTSPSDYFVKSKEVIPMSPPSNSLFQTLHLHLELTNPNLSENHKEILQKYGKVERSISRDVLVPSSMTLHALHYLLQRAFGWQNSHLHHFELPEAVFDQLTGGTFKRWGELCGVFFRMPSEETQDYFWDDDYDGNNSFRTWLCKKYCGPYRYNGYREFYPECQLSLREFYEAMPTLKIVDWFGERYGNHRHYEPDKIIPLSEATVDEVSRNVYLGDDLHALLERLTLKDLLLLDTDRATVSSADRLLYAVPVTKTLRYFYDYGDGWQVDISSVTSQDKAAAAPEIAVQEKPLCISRDGLGVMDDVGGLMGYCDFLYSLHHDDPDERASLRDWARMQGWTGRMLKAENIL